MSVTKVLMAAGTFDVQWRTDDDGRPVIPASIAGPDNLWFNDHVVIGPRGLVETVDNHADRLAAVVAANGYRGRITAVDTTGVSGEGLASWLGSPEGDGPWLDTRTRKTSATSPSTWLNEFLPCNGISKGTVTGGTSFAGTARPFYNRLAYVNWVAENADAEWTIDADGALNMAPSTTLFPTPSATAATVITRKPSGDEGGLSGVEAVDLGIARDGSNVASRSVVFHSATTKSISYATATQTPSGVRWLDADGNTPEDWSVAGVAPREGAAAATAFASRMIARQSVAPVTVTLTSRTHNVTAEVEPGARVWVHDVDAGLTDTANQITWQGEVITPLQMRVNALTVPITADQGVYLVVNGDEWHDVSEYVEYEAPFVSWDVSISGRRINRSPITEDLIVFGPQSRQSRALLTGITDSETYTPTMTNWSTGTGGSATTSAEFNVHVGGKAELNFVTIVGTTGAGRGASGDPTISLPTTHQLRFLSGQTVVEYGTFRIVANGAEYRGIVEGVVTDPTVVRLRYLDASARAASMSSTLPAAWTAGDTLGGCVIIPVEET